MASDLQKRDLDHYEAWYTDKLWNLLPAIYRAEDSTDLERAGPLRELVARIGAQAAIVRRSIDRLWEDQSIETCDDWVIAYLGDLLATKLVASLDARGHRVDVAKTIYYRRRKGTVGLLEELATDVTGWHVRVVELFRRLARTRHLLDPAIGQPVVESDPLFALQRAQGLIGPRTRTGAGGIADLRNPFGASLTPSAFDELFHTADVRRGRGATGWQNIPRIGVFVWRLHSFPLDQVTPVRVKKCPNQMTFDPTGRDVPLFAVAAHTFGDQWVSPAPHQVPGPITRMLLATESLELTWRCASCGHQNLGADLVCANCGDPKDVTYLYRADRSDPPPSSLAVWRQAGPVYLLVPRDDITFDPRAWKPAQPTTKPWIDPERGRLVWQTAAPAAGSFLVSYQAGFSAEIGAGSYDRPIPDVPEGPAPPSLPPVRGGGGAFAAAIAGVARGTVTIEDSRTYDLVSAIGAVEGVVIRAAERQRPLLRPRRPRWRITGMGDATLVLDGLFLSGDVDLVLAGTFARVTLSCCTLDPGSWDAEHARWRRAVDGRRLSPSQIRIVGQVRELLLDRSIVGPIVTGKAGTIEYLTARECIIQSTRPAERAISLTSGEVALSRSTVLGIARVHRLDASECILRDVVDVDDRQHGCVRFSAWCEGSHLPRKYESVRLPQNADLFTSTELGQPAYAQLLATTSAQISEGAEDGSEMGAFWRERNAVKERSLLIKYQEYLPVGLQPVVIHVT